MTDLAPVIAARDLGPRELLQREWLVANGLGGYASGTLPGVPTRRYHGLLIAAHEAPLGRLVMLNHVTEALRFPDHRRVEFGGEEVDPESGSFPGAPYLAEFRLELGLPVWRFQIGDAVVEKRVVMPHEQNTVHLAYRLIEGPEVRLHVRPSIQFRAHEAAVDDPLATSYRLTSRDGRFEIAGEQGPPLRLWFAAENGELRLDRGRTHEVYYRAEADRGYPARGVLWSPGRFAAPLTPGRTATLIASTEAWSTIDAMSPEQASKAEHNRRHGLLEHATATSGLARELVLAADQFIVTPGGRIEEATRARASGRDVRTVIAGYHWFTDWGRDTMISLEGLTLTTGRFREASWILHTFGAYVRDGLLPNMFPEGEREGLYHTADASLWYFHAVDRYTELSGDRGVLRALLPVLEDILRHHLKGTRFGIRVDPDDGLLTQGADGYQLTWMDAKVDDWVVTPRRGKAVEINALYYNALCLLERWLREERGDQAADEIAVHAARARESFNRRFWYDKGGYLYDVVDGESGDDVALRPNQVLAVSLPNPVLDRRRWQAVLDAVSEHLLTPVGLRSLAPSNPDYKPKYFGNRRSRDAAYHQGTVWAWLIGPMVDAWCHLHPDDRAGARRLLEGFRAQLSEACIGQIAEVFDAEAPFAPRGCIAQAWSVAEVLRCWVKTAARDEAGP